MDFTADDFTKIETELLRRSVKDSGFSDATLPLDGGELITVVQSGENKKLYVREFADNISNGAKDVLNVTELYQIAGCTLDYAIATVGGVYRQEGLIITFLNTGNTWSTYQYKGITLDGWLDTSYWEEIAWKSIIDAEITQVREDFDIINGQINNKVTEATNAATSAANSATAAQASLTSVTTIQSNINETANQVTIKASEVQSNTTIASTAATTAQSYAQQTQETYTELVNTADGLIIQSAKTAISSLVIGGRNLLSLSNITGTATTDYFGGNTAFYLGMTAQQVWRIQGWAVHTAGTYSLGFWAKSSIAATVYASVCNLNTSAFNLTTDWKYFTLENTEVPSDNLYLNSPYNGTIEFVPQSNCVLYIGNVKVEQGSKCTTYTPSVEDVDTNITTLTNQAQYNAEHYADTTFVTITNYTAELSILNDSISSKVSQTDYNSLSGKVDSLQTTVTQNSTSIAAQATSINDLTGRMSTAEAKITSDAINLTVSTQVNTARDNAISASQSYVDTNYVNNTTYNSGISNLQNQINGAINDYFYDYDPTLTNVPASTWTTDDVKNNHLGDIFYNTTTGKAYRFALVNSVYQWILVQDTDITLALANAAQALTNAAAAQSAADTANTSIANITSDNVLSSAEKPSQLALWNQVYAEYSPYVTQGTSYNITTEVTGYTTAYTNLANYLNGGTTYTSGTPLFFQSLNTNTTIVGSDYRTYWQNYYTARTTLLNKITDQAKAIAISEAQNYADLTYVTKTTYSSDLTILNNSISAKVSQTDFNSLSEVVSTHTTEIAQNTTDITLKVSQTDYTGATITSLINQSASTVLISADHIQLTGTSITIATTANVSTALNSSKSYTDSQVTILNTSISSKVSQTDFNNLSDTVSTHTTEIAQNTSDISLKVSTTDYTGNTIASLINQTATTIQISADKINLVGSSITLATTANVATSLTTANTNAQSYANTAQTNAQAYTDTNYVSNTTFSSQLTILNNSISSKVSQTDFNNLAIGGTNLLNSSSLIVNNNNANWGITGTNAVDTYTLWTSNGAYIKGAGVQDNSNVNNGIAISFLFQNLGVNAGDQVVFSVDVQQISGSGSSIAVFHGTPATAGGWWGATLGRVQISNTDNTYYKRYSIAFTVPELSEFYNTDYVLYLCMCAGVSGELNCKNALFAKGNKDSGWSASSADSVNQYTYSSFVNQLPTQINAEITTSVQSGGTVYNAVQSSFTLSGNGISLMGKTIDISGAAVFSNFGGTNLLSNSASRVLPTFATDNDNYQYFSDSTCYLEAGVIYIMRGKCPSGLQWSGTHGITGSTNAVLWLYDTVNNQHYIVSDYRAATTGSTFTVEHTGYHELRLNVYKAGSYEFDNIKIEVGQVATAWSPSPTDITNSLTASQNSFAQRFGYTDYAAMSNNTLGATLISGGYINTDCIAVNSIAANKLVANSITASQIAAGTITFDRLVGTDITALGAVTAGSFNIGSGKFVVDSSGNLTASNVNLTGVINATSGTFSGTVNGVTGTFRSLTAQDSSGNSYGSISFGSLGMTLSGDILHQGSVNDRSYRFYTADVWCRGMFGHYTSSVMYVYNNIAYFYVNGADKPSDYLQVTLNSYTGSNGGTFYLIDLYPGEVGYTVTAHGNAQVNDLYGFVVDIVYIYANVNTDYHYYLVAPLGKEVIVANVNDSSNRSYIATINAWYSQLTGGSVWWMVNAQGLVNPSRTGGVNSNAWMIISQYDNNWS